MTKKMLALGLIALMISSNAFASRARQLVMGNADPLGAVQAGTLYYDDNLNHIYNPSFANNYKNWASIERSNAYAVKTGGTFGTNSAEGGLVTSVGSMNLGVYVDRGGAVVGSYPAAGTPIHPIDLTLAGGNDFKWGAGLTHAEFRGSGGQSRYLQGRFGAQFKGLEPYAHILINGDDKGFTATAKTKNEEQRVGARYHVGDWTPFVAGFFRKLISTSNAETKTSVYGAGAGRVQKLANDIQLNYAGSFWRREETGVVIVPLDLSVEAPLASWITGRAGLSYRLFDRTHNISNSNATTGRMGATINATKGVGLDFAVGSGFSGTSNGSVDAPNLDFSSGTFAAASLNYNW